jgi:colicin import membrane protein
MAKKQAKQVKVKISGKVKRTIPKRKIKADRKIHELARKVNEASEGLQKAVRLAKKHDRQVAKLVARLEAELKLARKAALKAQKAIDQARKTEKKAEKKLKAAVDAELKRLARSEKQQDAKADKAAKTRKQKAAKAAKGSKAKQQKNAKAAKVAKVHKQKKQANAANEKKTARRKSVGKLIRKRNPVALLNGNAAGKSGKGKQQLSLRKLSSKKLVKAAGSLKLNLIKPGKAKKRLKALKYKGKAGKVVLFDMRKTKRKQVPV